MSQNYTPTEWVDNRTVGTASVMNNMEKGIENAHNRIDGVDSQIKDVKKKTYNILTPEMFGAVGDGIVDDTNAIQTMFDNATCGQKINFKANTKYRVTDTINIPTLLEVDGCNCFIVVDNALAGKFVFYYGVARDNHVLDTFLVQNEFKNFNIQHYGDVEGRYFNAIMLDCDCKVKNIYTWGMNITIGVSSDYIDMIIIDGINIWGQWGDDYAIQTGFQGDCREVKNVHMFHKTKSGKVIKVGDGHNVCRIKGIINGAIYVGKSTCELSDLHLEFGNITFDNSNATLKNMFIFSPAGESDVLIKGHSNIVIEDCIFNYYSERDYPSNDEFNNIEITGDNHNINIKNCFKNMLPSTDIKFKIFNGIKVKSLDEFNSNSLNNSISSVIRNGQVISYINPANRKNDQYQLFGENYFDNSFKWDKSSGNYFYRVAQVIDEERKLGTSWSTEKNISVTLDGKSPLIYLNGYPRSNYKIYRGKTSGSYDEYAILSPNSPRIYDRGSCVNGCNWEKRTAGGVDTYLNVQMYEKHPDGTVTIKSNSCPTFGVWKKGDKAINTNIAVGNVKSWIYNGTSWISEGTY